jgi:peroxiredoxin
VSVIAPTVAQQITQMQTELAAGGHLPSEVVQVFAAEQAQLAAAGVPDGVLAPGEPMVDAELLDVHGAPTSLAAARDGRAAVVVLYRGGWCPYCNLTLRAYEAQLLPELARRDVRLIAVSPQAPDGSLSTAEKDALSFTVLSDPGNQLARGLGVLFEPGEPARAAQLGLGLDTTVVNADGGSGLPMPTVALVDAAGTLRFLDVHPDYTTRTEPAAILAAIEAELG